MEFFSNTPPPFQQSPSQISLGQLNYKDTRADDKWLVKLDLQPFT